MYLNKLEVVASRACGFACVVLAGASERLADPSLIGVVTPSDLAGSILVEILYCGEGREVKLTA